MNRATRRASALLCAAALTSGCFRYVPAPLGTVPLGEQVQVHLSPRAQVELSQQGTRVESAVRGILAERRGSELLLRVPIAAERGGFFRADIEREMPIAEADVLGIDMRQFSPGRTALLVAGSVGGGALVVFTIIAASRSGGSGPGGGVEELRIPIWSVPIR